jgi:hypothetical protein
MNQTDCNQVSTQQIEIFQVKNKPVIVTETKTDVSSNGGFLVLGAIDRELKLIDSVMPCFQGAQRNRQKSVKDENRIEHSLRNLMCQRVFQMALGYEDGLDADDLRHDRLLQLSVGKTDLLGSQPMMSRLENWVSRSDIWRGWTSLVQFYAKHFHKAGEPVMMEIDSTNDPVHGQLGMFNGYYDEHCFHPLLITEAKSGFPFGVILRSGLAGSATRAKSILKRIIRDLRAAIPGVEIIIKGDCAFGNGTLLNWFDEAGIGYILGVGGNAVLYKQTAELKEEVLKEYEQEKKPLQRFMSLTYRAESWTKARDVVAKVEHTPEGINIRFVVSSMKAEDPESLYQSYHTRAKGIEAVIEQMKNGLRFDKTACHTRTPNQMRYFESALAWILHIKLADKMEKKLKERPTVQTLIQKVLKVAAIVKESFRRFVIELSSADPHTELLLYALQI